MKQAKFLLTSIIILAAITYTLAFKARRQFNAFYGYGTMQLSGQQTSGCVVLQQLAKTTSAAGQVTPYLTTTFITTSPSACITKVIPDL